MSELHAADAAEWEAWLEAHHEREPEVWLVYWKKGSGKTSVAWAEAVEVALKFGWIDGLIRTIDEHRYAQRWTPRRPKSKWSLVNKNIALRHIENGEMRPLGLAAVEAARSSGNHQAASVRLPTSGSSRPSSTTSTSRSSAIAKKVEWLV